MSGKIYVRERRKVEEGEKKPRFRVVATTGKDLKFRVDHIRKNELEAIAEAEGFEVVYLPKGDGEGDGSGSGKKD